jgi:ribosome-binding factor A
MSRRVNRMEEACKEELSAILQREIKDPRVGFVTITRVKLTADLQHAKVYVSVMGTEDEVRQSLEGLESARGYLRSRLGKHLRLKYLPEIDFQYEMIAQEALELEELLKQVTGDGKRDDGDQEK